MPLAMNNINVHRDKDAHPDSRTLTALPSRFTTLRFLGCRLQKYLLGPKDTITGSALPQFRATSRNPVAA
jgi:hypothetical protein